MTHAERSRPTGRFCGRGTVLTLLALSWAAIGAPAAEKPGSEADEPWLRPYSGPSRSDIDATTLDGKVLCGYQGDRKSVV